MAGRDGSDEFAPSDPSPGGGPPTPSADDPQRTADRTSQCREPGRRAGGAGLSSTLVTETNLPFDRWKNAVGLPPYFPRLKVLRFDGDLTEYPYLPEELQTKRSELLQRLQGPALRVTVPLGHGATTLARWVTYRVGTDCLQMRMVPVLISLDDLVDHRAALAVLTDIASKEDSPFTAPGPLDLERTDSPLHISLPAGPKPLKGTARKRAMAPALDLANQVTEAALGGIDVDAVLDEATHAAVAWSLVEARWERVVGDYRYAALIGAEQTDPAAIATRVAELSLVLGPHTSGRPIDWEAVASFSPTLADADLLAEFMAENELKVCVNLDLSCTRYGRLTVRDLASPSSSADVETPRFKDIAVETFLSRIKDMSDSGETLLARWNRDGAKVVKVVPYLSPGLANHFQSLLRSSITEVDTAEFDELDVFAVLAAHYPLESTDQRRPELVSSVFTAGLMEEFVQRKLALTSMARHLEDYLQDEKTFTYHIASRALRELPSTVDRLRGRMDNLTMRVRSLAARLQKLDGLVEEVEGIQADLEELGPDERPWWKGSKQ